MGMDFSAWDEQVDASTHVVAVSGEIDIFTAPEFKERINGAIDAGRDHVIVDLTATTFIDSSSLGVLISAHRRLGNRDGRLIIACDVPAVLNTFKITGLNAVLEVVRDREAALAARNGPAPAPGQAAA
jgi:anti-sigma B factor antagonist